MRDWERHEEVYVQLITDTNGFAAIEAISKTAPTESPNYVKAKVWHLTAKRDNENNKPLDDEAEDIDVPATMRIEYPFDRYYMEESKAYDAEVIARRARRDTAQSTYAIVHIKDGDAVLKDVMVNGTSIKDIVAHQQAIEK